MIRISHLSFAYPSLPEDDPPAWVLREIDLQIEAGQFVAIMGPTGVGKTTFCLALNGILPHLTGGRMRGDVWIDGKNTKQASVPELARQVGLVFQEAEAHLFNTSVEDEIAFGLENLGLPRQEIRQRIDWSLGVVDMAAYRNHSPARLSGGQQKRIAIAAVLAMLPQVLVLDEPTVNLDRRGVAELLPILRSLSTDRKMTVVMASNESEVIAEYCDRVIVLDEGTVALDGTPAQVFSQVDRLHAIGVDTPQVCQAAVYLNRAYAAGFTFYTLNQARDDLAGMLDEKSRQS